MAKLNAPCLPDNRVFLGQDPDNGTPAISGAVIAGSLIFGLIFFALIAGLFYFRYRCIHSAPRRLAELEAFRVELRHLDYRSWQNRARTFLWTALCLEGRAVGTADPSSHQRTRRAHRPSPFGADAPAFGLRYPPSAFLDPAPPYDPYRFLPEQNVYVLHYSDPQEAAPVRSSVRRSRESPYFDRPAENASPGTLPYRAYLAADVAPPGRCPAQVSSESPRGDDGVP